MGQRRSIEGSRILITGASQGIGRALALAAARQGAKLLAAARSEPLLRELAEEARKTGTTLHTVVADVTSPEDRQRMLDAAVRDLGGLDVLVNNAGIGATGAFAEASQERLRKIFEVNFFGTTETTRLFLPLLRKGNKPAIVNVSSILGKRAFPSRSEYSASKFAVQGFSEALRAELSKDGIDVLIVNPGLTQTNFSQNMLEQKARYKLDHMRGMTSEQVADATLRALARGKNEINLTFKGRLLVFFNRFFPGLTDWLIRRKVRKLHAQGQAPEAALPTPKEQEHATTVSSR
jgi:short-subunit dehydrogenase